MAKGRPIHTKEPRLRWELVTFPKTRICDSLGACERLFQIAEGKIALFDDNSYLRALEARNNIDYFAFAEQFEGKPGLYVANVRTNEVRPYRV